MSLFMFRASCASTIIARKKKHNQTQMNRFEEMKLKSHKLNPYSLFSRIGAEGPALNAPERILLSCWGLNRSAAVGLPCSPDILLRRLSPVPVRTIPSMPTSTAVLLRRALLVASSFSFWWSDSDGRRIARSSA